MRLRLNKRIILPLVFLFLSFVSLPAASAESALQAITLKDGTVLKGRVIEVRNGFYQIQTSLTNPIEVREEDIVSINNLQGSATQNPSSSFHNSLSLPDVPAGVSGQDLKGQVSSLSQTLLADPEVQAAIKEMTEDPEIRQLLGQQDLLSAIMSMNPSAIQNNSNVQQLMQNPKMQRLMNMIAGKFLPKQN